MLIVQAGFARFPAWPDWQEWRLLASAVSEDELQQFREHERTGRVLDDNDFQNRPEKQLGRVLRRQKPGPKKIPKR